MIPVIVRLALRYISRRFFQSAMFVLGVALGVGVVVAIDIANSSASRAFTLSSESIVGRATHQIVGGPNGFPSAVYTRLRRQLGIQQSAPVVTEFVRVAGSDQALRLLGVDPLAEPPFRSYLAGQDTVTDWNALNRLIVEPGAVVISQSLAGRLGLAPEDRLEISAGGRFSRAQLVGILQPDNNASRQALDDLIISDIASAQELIGMAGRISRIDLILDAEQIAPLSAALPAGIRLVDVKQEKSLDQMIAAFELNLQAMSLLALVVGLFLIYNTVTFSVVQRRGALGIMRSLGTTRGQIFRFILLEAFILGLVGTALGLALGVILGRGAVALVSQTISDLYFSVNVTGISIMPGTLAKGALIGVAASLLAAALPSWDATRTPPAGIMKRSIEEETARRLLPAMTGGALVAESTRFCLAGRARQPGAGFCRAALHRSGRRALYTRGDDRHDAPAAAARRHALRRGGAAGGARGHPLLEPHGGGRRRSDRCRQRHRRRQQHDRQLSPDRGRLAGELAGRADLRLAAALRLEQPDCRCRPRHDKPSPWRRPA